MSRPTVWIIALFLLGSAQVSAAQVALRVGGGAVVPQSPGLVQDAAHAGIGGEVGLHVPVRSWLHLVPMVSYHQSRLEGQWPESDGVMGMGSGTVNVHIVSPWDVAGVRPYALVGAGGYRFEDVPDRTQPVCLATVLPPCPPIDDTRDVGLRPGYQLGAGLTVRTTTRLRLFAETTYARILSETGTYSTMSGHLASLSVHAGVLLAW